MTKEQAEALIRNTLSQINLPLKSHQDLQMAVTVILDQNVKPLKSNLEAVKDKKNDIG